MKSHPWMSYATIQKKHQDMMVLYIKNSKIKYYVSTSVPLSYPPAKKWYAKKHLDSRTSTSFAHELFIPYNYWYDMYNSIPEIANMSITRKTGVIHNEINRFRYDVLLTIDLECSLYRNKCALNKYMWGSR